MKDVSVCFVFFRTLNLRHLDAALYSVACQDLTSVREILILDNNTDFSEEAISQCVTSSLYPKIIGNDVRLVLWSEKHGDTRRTQSWSVNRVCREATAPWILFTRADYIIAFDALARFTARAQEMHAAGRKPFLSGWCWQMAYDREARNVDANVDIEKYRWREKGMPALLQHPHAFRFHETDQDAGVWFTRKEYLAEAGWMNENLVSWGYQQSEFQRMLQNRASCTLETIQDYLFAHQHHSASRDFAVAQSEFNKHGRG